MEDLPKEVYDFKRTMTKRYREAVYEHFNLQYKQIEGDGNCFFGSCAAAFMYVSHLLRPDGKEIDSLVMRNFCCGLLRKCVSGKRDWNPTLKTLRYISAPTGPHWMPMLGNNAATNCSRY